MRTATINGKEYPLHFGMKALHTFAKSEGVEDVGGALQSLVFLQNLKPGKPLAIADFERISRLSEAVIANGCHKAKQQMDIDADDIYEALMLSPQAVKSIVETVVDGLNDYLTQFAVDADDKKKIAAALKG